MRPGYVCTTMNLQIVLNTPKNPYLNQATQKNTCQIVLDQTIWELKISNPKDSWIIPVTWNLEFTLGVRVPNRVLQFCKIPQSCYRPDDYFQRPASWGYFQSSFLISFCFKILNPGLQSLVPKKSVGEPSVVSYCYLYTTLS